MRSVRKLGEVLRKARGKLGNLVGRLRRARGGDSERLWEREYNDSAAQALKKLLAIVDWSRVPMVQRAGGKELAVKSVAQWLLAEIDFRVLVQGEGLEPTLERLLEQLSRPDLNLQTALQRFGLPPRILWELLQQLAEHRHLIQSWSDHEALLAAIEDRLEAESKLEAKKRLEPSRYVVCVGGAYGEWYVFSYPRKGPEPYPYRVIEGEPGTEDRG